MLTLCAIENGSGYAKNHLEQNDYYAEGEKVIGQWRGRGAELLNLSGEVTHEQFEAMRQGLDPRTGEKLRQRESADRTSADGSKQSIGRSLYDLTLSAPKSVSIMAGPGGDERLIAADDRACFEALAEAEKHAATRVRVGGANDDRVTGNLIMATYRHDTSRELDPQLHLHAVAANMSYDAAEGRWKALQAGGIYDRRAYISEVYRNVLAKEVIGLGYEIENRQDSKGKDLGFEIVGISETLREKFSQRSAQRDAAIAEFTKNKGRPPTNREIAVLVRETRSDKLTEISTAEVKAKQEQRLTGDEMNALARLRHEAENRSGRRVTRNADKSLEYASEHVFERVSVAHDFDVLTEALHHGRGGIDLGELKGALQVQEAAEMMVRSGTEIATRESLARERDMIGRINRGIGAHEKLGGPENHFQASPLHCTSEQREAVASILNSRDLAVNLRGAAGTGKTHTLKQIKYGLHTVGKEVVAIAPTRSAVEELQREGFAEAVTSQRLLSDEKMQGSLAGKVVIVDEAGMISGRQMADLLQIAEKHHARLIFSGDSRQLRSVEASDALRILEKESQLKTVALTGVQRQTGDYLEAIRNLREAPMQGLFQLEKMGAIQEVPFLERPKTVAATYAKAKALPGAKGKERSVLIICPSHEEIGRVTEAIREDRRDRGELGMGHLVERLEPLNWTNAQKGEIKNLQAGQVLVFHKGVKGVGKNENLTVLRTEQGRVVAQNERGQERMFTAKQSRCFGVFERRTIELAANDRLMLQSNRRDRDFRATNGEMVSVNRVDEMGRIRLKDGRILPKNYLQFNYGYAVTAHRSQGKTVDAVIISGDAMNRELFYVAASRGRESIAVLTGNKDALRRCICRSGQRQSASELARRASIGEMIEDWAATQGTPQRKSPGERFLEGLRARGAEVTRRFVARMARAISSWTELSSDVGISHGREIAQVVEDRSPNLEQQGR